MFSIRSRVEGLGSNQPLFRFKEASKRGKTETGTSGKVDS